MVGAMLGPAGRPLALRFSEGLGNTAGALLGLDSL